jgi:hypothetical protein
VGVPSIHEHGKEKHCVVKQYLWYCITTIIVYYLIKSTEVPTVPPFSFRTSEIIRIAMSRRESKPQLMTLVDVLSIMTEKEKFTLKQPRPSVPLN